MRVGDYAHAGSANISVIDTDSYWIDGNFEETKLARVCIGDRVEAKLMGYAQPILGHVASVTRGINVSDAAAGVQGLPNVNPVFTWVRLAQRVPVRVAIDHVPPGVPLVSGLTATVTIKEEAVGADGRSWLGRGVAAIETRLSDILVGPPARSGCIPATTTEQAIPQSLPADTVKCGTHARADQSRSRAEHQRIAKDRKLDQARRSVECLQPSRNRRPSCPSPARFGDAHGGRGMTCVFRACSVPPRLAVD